MRGTGRGLPFAPMTLPVICAPMFLVSGPDLVVEACRAGLVGTFPSLNRRATEGFEAWLAEIEARLAEAPDAAPFGVNLIVHRTNPRLEADLEVVVRHRVPLVITSLGANASVVEAVHGYGGKVFHDVTTLRHARKAAGAGVDGLILVCAGAGGHAGTLSPFALLDEVRAFFDGTIVLAGAITNGRHVAAARLLGADLAYMGTRFIATRESMADPDYKAMVCAARAEDIVHTAAVSGIPANFLRPSLERFGLDADHPPAGGTFDLSGEGEARAWKTVWSAGQGVGGIVDVPTVADLAGTLRAEYLEAVEGLA